MDENIRRNSHDGGTSSTSFSGNTQSNSRASLWNPMNILTGKRKGGTFKTPSKHPLKRRKTKVPPWTDTFVCLANKDQECIPEASERAELHLAGLGEKKIQLSTDSDANAIHFEHLEQFLKLSSGGGYELLRSE